MPSHRRVLHIDSQGRSVVARVDVGRPVIHLATASWAIGIKEPLFCDRLEKVAEGIGKIFKRIAFNPNHTAGCLIPAAHVSFHCDIGDHIKGLRDHQRDGAWNQMINKELQYEPYGIYGNTSYKVIVDQRTRLVRFKRPEEAVGLIKVFPTNHELAAKCSWRTMAAVDLEIDVHAHQRTRFVVGARLPVRPNGS